MKSNKVCIITRSTLAPPCSKAWQSSTQLWNGLLNYLNQIHTINIKWTHLQLYVCISFRFLTPYTLTSSCIFSILLSIQGAGKENLLNNQELHYAVYYWLSAWNRQGPMGFLVSHGAVPSLRSQMTDKIEICEKLNEPDIRPWTDWCIKWFNFSFHVFFCRFFHQIATSFFWG